MKKELLIPVLMAASTLVNAADSVSASSAATSTTIATGDCSMLGTSFGITVSANVGLSWACNTTRGAVQSGSTKGSALFGGNTAGGAVAKCGSGTPNSSTGYSAVPTAATDDGCP